MFFDESVFCLWAYFTCRNVFLLSCVVFLNHHSPTRYFFMFAHIPDYSKPWLLSCNRCCREGGTIPSHIPPSLNRQLWNNRLSLAQRTYFLCRNIAYVLCIFLIVCMIFFALLLRSMTYVTIVTRVYVVQQMLQSLWTVRHTHHHHPTTTTYQHRFWYPFHHPGQDYSRG